jgi:hypothetical protein
MGMRLTDAGGDMVNSFGPRNLTTLSETELSCINPEIELPLTFLAK